jgi:hypothetical protein
MRHLQFFGIFLLMRYLRLENGNLIKNALSKIESQCHVDSKHVFVLKIVRVLSEKNIFKLDAKFEILNLRPVFLYILPLCVIFTMKTAI